MPTSPIALHPATRSALMLLAFCLVLQCLALSARQALGPWHFHLNTPAARAALQAAAAPQPDREAALPFGGQLRSHRAPAFHDELERHSHEPGLAGLVSVTEDVAASPSARWATLVRQALDLPGLVAVARAGTAPPGTSPRPSAAAALSFASQIIPPPLRPPRG